MMELDLTNGLLMISQGFIRGRREIQVKPRHSAIIGSNNHVVSRRMDVHRGNPFDTGLELVYEGLLDQVVDLDLCLGSHEEVGVSCRTELTTLDQSLDLGNGNLS